MEQLDEVFSKSTASCIKHGCDEAKWVLRLCFGSHKNERKPEFLKLEKDADRGKGFRDVPLEDLEAEDISAITQSQRGVLNPV